jgi:hypothetical protein
MLVPKKKTKPKIIRPKPITKRERALMRIAFEAGASHESVSEWPEDGIHFHHANFKSFIAAKKYVSKAAQLRSK